MQSSTKRFLARTQLRLLRVLTMLVVTLNTFGRSLVNLHEVLVPWLAAVWVAHMAGVDRCFMLYMVSFPFLIFSLNLRFFNDSRVSFDRRLRDIY